MYLEQRVLQLEKEVAELRGEVHPEDRRIEILEKQLAALRREEELKAMLAEKGIKWPKGISYSETFEPDREREVKALKIVKSMPKPSQKSARKEAG